MLGGVVGGEKTGHSEQEGRDAEGAPVRAGLVLREKEKKNQGRCLG